VAGTSEPHRVFLPGGSPDETTFLGDLLRRETVGGGIMLAAAAVAVLWANSPWNAAYESFCDLRLGPLDLRHWASEGALTLFFFVAGLELKRELVVGSLRRPADALVPVVAALAGVVTPALVYVAVNLAAAGDLRGWAVPAATDIAFALAVLAVVGSGLPASLRAFLLTLAVVDDLVVIAVIAVVFTDEIRVGPFLLAVTGLGVYAFLQRLRGESWLWYVPLSLAVWWCVHESGVHATVAGVAMGLLTRVRPDPGEPRSPAEALEHLLTPYSAGLAVPFFAFTSAGVPVVAGSLLGDPVVLGVFLGLVVGKPAGVLAGAAVVIRLTRAELGPDLTWRDLVGAAVLAGIGFTVALLVAELSFPETQAAAAKTAVLAGSALSALLAAVVLRRRRRAKRRRRASWPRVNREEDR
jgi:NhaA family Na+:H+ antiporter